MSPRKFPVKPIQGLPVLAGLVCVHANCGALFSDMEGSNSHAETCHAGKAMANTCAIQELENASGGVELLLVVEELEQLEVGE
jgi:hypothetical protein